MTAFRTIIAAICRKIIAEGKAVLCSLHAMASDVRRNRALIEKEIHHGEYRLHSKNDDDLPALSRHFRSQPR